MQSADGQATVWRFSDLFDVGDIQQLQDAFSAAHRVPTVIVDPAGRPITRPSRALPEHDQAIPRPPAGARIDAGGVHLASWLAGRPSDMSAARFEEICGFLRAIAAGISQQAAATVELHRTRAARECAEAERDRLAAHLRLSAGVEAVGRLAGGIAHDFGNFLTAIQGYAELLVAAQPDPDDQRTPAARILTVSDRAADLVRRLLAFSRLRPGAHRPLDLAQLVDETAALLERTLPASVRVVREITAVAPVLGDAACLESALLNLGVNAGHAMPNGGVLTFEVRNGAAAGGGLGSSVEIRVRDTGIGMDAETRRRIFEPFFTTRLGGDGTGLGLTRVHSCVTSHGGTIEVASEPGQGAVFTIRLPAVSADLRERQAAG